jgi:excisionase family DNA binding protein
VASTYERAEFGRAQARVPRFYTVTEAAQLLRLSAATVYREIHAGRFPAIRVRGSYVIPAEAFDAMEQAAFADAAHDEKTTL